MAQRPNNTDLPPKETTQPLKGKGPHQQNDPGDWESQEREPWANAMECVFRDRHRCTAIHAWYSRFSNRTSILPYQPSRPLLRSRATRLGKSNKRAMFSNHRNSQRTSGNLRSDTKGVAGHISLKRTRQRWHQGLPPLAKGKPFVSTWTGAGVVCTWTTEAADGDKGAMKLSHKLAILPYINAPDLPDTSGEGDSTPSGSAEAGEDGNPSHSGETERGAGVKTTSSSEDERGRTPRRRRRRRGADSPDGGDEALRRAICENTHISKLKTCEKALEEPLPLLAEAEECARTARSLVV
ncbi:uncharacterized protein ATNIH1004_011432 [Aspergillus tanneri]|uniref:Uncharacterized protein n=1 Tax=Aspergillus tanneri TaxID=1220188 RepID=A0A5M9MHT6_9EURO|nr:uncharacterized protein ATNIH1004_011432 [Aspergillus tanneri]KAA8642487.1 hypothetical protein ATNIH1004_011432 [Aspergillus tanneri]